MPFLILTFKTWVSNVAQNQKSKIVEVSKRTQNKALQTLNFKGPRESIDYLHK